MTTQAATAAPDTGTTQAGTQTTAADDATLLTPQADPSADQGTPKDPAAEGQKADAAPVEYKFTAPDGVELHPARLEKFTALARELKLSPTDAQKIVDMAAQAEVDNVTAHAATVKGWYDEVKNDAEIGGDKLVGNLVSAKKAIELGPPELKQLLNDTGLGNHPAIVKWAIKVGQALSEDKFVPAGNAAPSKGDAASRLYPSTSSAA